MSAAVVYDAIVLGVGGTGSAAVYHLARQGRRVLGLEQFNIPHDLGSSHGITRIIRLPYFEHPSYIPLLRRAYELWRELERSSGRLLLNISGSIDAGPKAAGFSRSRCDLAASTSCRMRSSRARFVRPISRLSAARADAWRYCNRREAFCSLSFPFRRT